MWQTLAENTSGNYECNMGYGNEDEQGLIEPPHYDMLIVKFRGDQHTITLPYCEVANGDFKSIKDNAVEISVRTDKGTDTVKTTYPEFVKLVEDAFDIKEITYMAAQFAQSYDTIQIL